MKDYGLTKSTIKPEPFKMDEYSVYICTDIEPFEKEIEGEMFTGWQYKMVRYSKDEYIMLQQQKIDEEITNTQLALCEIVEGMEG